MNEIEIINNIKKIIKNPAALKLNDDVFFDKKKSLVASIDTYNEKTHYMNFKYPDLIIKKAIRSSISDIISKGVNPEYLLISFSGSNKHFSENNIKLILKSIKSEQKIYHFSLIGGDTTKSIKSSFTICAYGFSNKIIKRNKCQLNDDIYITGNIGDSAVGLDFLRKKIKSSSKIEEYFVKKYFKPNIPFGFHKELHKFANTSMDVSDGLISDMKKLINNQKLSFEIEVDKIPISKNLNIYLKKNNKKFLNFISKGDDYQVLFTSHKKNRSYISRLSKRIDLKITAIGKISNSYKKRIIVYNKKVIKPLNYSGYLHKF